MSGPTGETGHEKDEYHPLEPTELRVAPTGDRSVKQRIPIDWVPHALSIILEQPLSRTRSLSSSSQPLLLLGDGEDAAVAPPQDELFWALSVLQLDTHPSFNLSSWISPSPSPSSAGVSSFEGTHPESPPKIPTTVQVLCPPQLQTSLHTAPATLRLNSASFPLWSTLGLGPLSGPKDVKNIVLVPSDTVPATRRRVGKLDPNTWATQKARTHELWAQIECWARMYEVRIQIYHFLADSSKGF